MRSLLVVVLAATLIHAQEPPVVPVAATVSSAPALPWLALRGDEALEFMRATPLKRFEDVPVGVTRPRRAFYPEGGPVESVIVKKLRPGRASGYWESYLSEIAAFELDRLLGLGMVPPTVEKRVDGELASAQLWVKDTVWLKELKGQTPPDVTAWNRQVYRQRVFDNLIGNIDRNEGNLLVYRTPEWHLVLVDHSRCFTGTQKMPFPMTRIDRELFAKLKALSEETLKARLGRMLVDGVRPLLRRRDAIVTHFETLAAAKGEAQVFVP